MDDEILYANSDLDLASSQDLTPLVQQLKANGLWCLSLTPTVLGEWYTIFEVDRQQTNPQDDIEELIAAVELLPEGLRSLWESCTIRREINVGFHCGSYPWSFNEGISSGLLGRMAALGIGLRLTIYPVMNITKAEPLEHSEEDYAEAADYAAAYELAERDGRADGAKGVDAPQPAVAGPQPGHPEPPSPAPAGGDEAHKVTG